MKESKIKDRMMGCLVGLAVGDAYGTTWEFTNKFQMPPADELSDYIIGGGPFNLKPGDWTDDTSMALCLSESLVEKGWNPDDQMDRYIKWWRVIASTSVYQQGVL
jgi:ADP-ribosyl-[dinitrogen reductase] hydrolase